MPEAIHPMTSNHKLSALLQGRTVQSTQMEGGVLTLLLDNGAVMTVQTGGPVVGEAAGSPIRAVRQAGTTLCLDLDNNTSLQITTAEETSSVLVRDSHHALLYAD